jgi:hypothetical protein
MGGPASGPPPPQTTVVVPGTGWVDVASRVVVQVGFPVVVAGVLLWFLLTRFQENMNAITTRMERNAIVVGAFVDELKLHTAELKAQTAYLGEQEKLLGEQGKLMGQIAGDAAKLVDTHQRELDVLERREGRHADP